MLKVLEGDVALQHAQNVLAAVALLPSSVGERAGPLVVNHAVVGDGPQSVVRLAVASAAEPVALSLLAACLDGAGSAERGEGRVAVQAVGVAAGGDGQLRGGVDADAGALDELGDVRRTSSRIARSSLELARIGDVRGSSGRPI
jgi:hypothetical protein